MGKGLSNYPTYNSENIREFSEFLADNDADLRKIIVEYGYPAVSLRKPGFAALVRLILEQQVSLMSAKAAYLKLREKIKDITPENILQLSEEELRQCYFSRQKTVYARALAQAVVDKTLLIEAWIDQPDEVVRRQLIQIKGIGEWTADNYLLLSLHRLDIFPAGDIALLNSIKKIKRLPVGSSKESILTLAESWRPYRSVASMLFWHAYIADRKINVDELDY
jgi:DNA-3-methyladenine glycosylase II